MHLWLFMVISSNILESNKICALPLNVVIFNTVCSGVSNVLLAQKLLAWTYLDEH